MNKTLIMLLMAGSLAACGDPPDPCKINPTYQANDGQWYEADGEPLDDDPCDAEDLSDDGVWKNPNKTKKPTPKVTIVKPVPKATTRGTRQ